MTIHDNNYKGQPIIKDRHMIAVDGLKAEVDIFYGHLSGLCLVELEFPTEEEALTYELPACFGESRNVTNDNRFCNKNLCSYRDSVQDLVNEIFEQ